MKMFKVYHSKNWALNSMLHFDDVELFNPHKDDYKVVAVVACDAVGETFQLTNHITEEWWNNENVCLIEKSRSTSVGDVVEDTKTGELWLCCSVGWKKVEWNMDLKSNDLWWIKYGKMVADRSNAMNR